MIKLDIEVQELSQKNKYNTLTLIDIRDTYSYQKGHIKNSKNIPVEILMQSPQTYLNYNETYYIYCQAGNTSKKVVNILNNRGYHTVNIKGGYNNYLLWK